MARDVDRSHLHPAFRSRLSDLDARIVAAGLPLQTFEAGRSPERQQALFAIGRVSGQGTFGKHVTKAKPWQSFHQHGFAEDKVFFVNGVWTWDEPEKGAWDEYTALCAAAGLRTLSFERPHVEMPLNLTDLMSGKYPEGGDATWTAWLDSMIESWGPLSRTVDGIVLPAPPPLQDVRPALVA